MFQRLEFMAWFAGSLVRPVSDSASRRADVQRLVDKLEEFVRRVRRAGLLFIVGVTGLITLSLLHPFGFLLWLIALPLAAFASAFSMLWPTRQLRRNFAARRSVSVLAEALSRLAISRSEIPLTSRAAFDLVVRRLTAVEALADDGGDTLLVEEAKRVGGRHLPRLVASFLGLPADQRTDARISAFTDGLSTISEDLDGLRERLLRARTDRFEIERQFIESRFPRRDGLASV